MLGFLKCMTGMGIFKLHIKGFEVGLIRISILKAVETTPINVKMATEIVSLFDEKTRQKTRIR